MVIDKSHRLLKAVATPFRKLGYRIHALVRLKFGMPRFWKRQHTKIIVCTGISFLGVIIAKSESHIVPHLILDWIGYGLHGFGLAPILERGVIAFSAMMD